MPESVATENALPSRAEQPALSVRSLAYAYGGGPAVLNGISFDVPHGQKVAVVGPSGAGKSTLLMHLNGLLPETVPATASIAAVSVDGVAISHDTLPTIRQRVGFVFQDPDDQLFCPTVREDVAFGPLNLGLSREEVLTRVTAGLKQVGLSGYEHRSTLQLSLGERKRVCVAGVLACQPQTLVLDEPFTNLDPRARHSLIDILKQFPGTQVIATHDLDLVVKLCDRVVVLDGGQIQADGPTRELLRDRVLMEKHGLEVPWQLR
ncbi:ATP-binding cassette domain-containing protein [bacterium]|nr:ATP-binding cassette domain-containing protein [bacterium]